MLKREGFFCAFLALFFSVSLLFPAFAGSSLYSFAEIGGMTYILEDESRYYVPSAVERQAESFYKELEGHSNVKSYIYLMNSSRTVNVLEDVTAVPRVYETIQACFPESTTDYLRISSLEEYGQFFYTTDHHWNYRGSYAGYCQIVHMLLGEEEPVLEPVETVEFPVRFNGTLNRILGRKDSQENFTVYRFDYPEMKIEINGKPVSRYGNQEAYYAGKYSTTSYASHYSNFYGGEHAVIHVETDRVDRGNLLVFSNSQSNALNLLLASHFRNTWIIDLKHTGRTFHLGKAVDDWNIGQVLILGDGLYFRTDYKYD